MPNVKQMIGGTFEDVGEAVVKPVVNEGMKDAEQGIKSVVQPQQPQAQKPTPQPGQPNPALQQQEQTKMLEARRVVRHWQDLETGQQKYRQVQKQKVTEEQKEEQQQEQVRQFEITQKKQAEKNQVVQQAQRKTEQRGGVNG